MNVHDELENTIGTAGAALTSGARGPSTPLEEQMQNTHTHGVLFRSRRVSVMTRVASAVLLAGGAMAATITVPSVASAQ